MKKNKNPNSNKLTLSVLIYKNQTYSIPALVKIYIKLVNENYINLLVHANWTNCEKFVL